MRTKGKWLLYPVLSLLLIFGLAGPLFAQEGPPPVPHPFYGTLTIGGSQAPAGRVVTAEVAGVERGSITTTVEGQYGSSSPLGPWLVVQGDIEEGAIIDFYVDGVEANEKANFASGTLPPTELNLTVTDTTAPTVASTSPVDGAIDVPVTATVSATFSKAMEGTTITAASFTLSDGGAVSGAVSYDAGTFTATFTPAADLDHSTAYTAVITIAVTDLAGNPLGAPYSWSFTTAAADTTPPTVASTFPADGAVEVAVDATVSATFSKAMEGTTITAASFTLSDGGAVSGAVSYDAGTFTATFTPAADLDHSTAYTAVITIAVTDLAGNPLGAQYSWGFTTAAVTFDPLSYDTSGDGVIDKSEAITAVADIGTLITRDEALEVLNLYFG